MNILIIEDDTMVRKALSHYLLESSHTVSIAANGHEALTVVENNRDIDLIICDIMMPVLTGPAFILMLKKYFPVQMPSVIIISGAKLDEEFLNKIEIQYDHFIRKPINYPKLATLIDELYRKKHAPATQE
jgi:two-component system response regulator ResD